LAHEGRECGAIHDSIWSVCSGLRPRGPFPIVCKRPVPEPRDNRAGFLRKGIGARYSCGTLSCAPELNPRSGAWWKYGASAVGHIAGSSGDTGNTGDVGIRFEIALKDEIALKEMIQVLATSGRLSWLAPDCGTDRKKTRARRGSLSWKREAPDPVGASGSGRSGTWSSYNTKSWKPQLSINEAPIL
jgi:hypothetical protein